MSDTVRPLARCGAQETHRLKREIASEVDALLDHLKSAGLNLWDVGSLLSCHRGTLRGWRQGETQIPAVKLQQLRQLAAVTAPLKKAGA